MQHIFIQKKYSLLVKILDEENSLDSWGKQKDFFSLILSTNTCKNYVQFQLICSVTKTKKHKEYFSAVNLILTGHCRCWILLTCLFFFFLIQILYL